MAIGFTHGWAAAARDEEFRTAARSWVLDCSWKEDPEEIEEMPDAEILRGIARHYDGGMAQFTRDAQLEEG